MWPHTWRNCMLMLTNYAWHSAQMSLTCGEWMSYKSSSSLTCCDIKLDHSSDCWFNTALTYNDVIEMRVNDQKPQSKKLEYHVADFFGECSERFKIDYSNMSAIYHRTLHIVLTNQSQAKMSKML